MKNNYQKNTIGIKQYQIFMYFQYLYQLLTLGMKNTISKLINQIEKTKGEGFRINVKTFTKKLINIINKLQIQDFNSNSQFLQLLSQFDKFVNMLIEKWPFRYNIVDIQRYRQFIWNKIGLDYVESSSLIKDFQKYQMKIMYQPLKKCLKCCTGFVKNFPILLHIQQDNKIPYLVIPNNEVNYQKIKKMFSALHNARGGIIIISNQYEYIQDKILISRGIQSKTYQYLKNSIQCKINQAMNALKQFQAKIQLQAIPLYDSIEQYGNSEPKQFIIRVDIKIAKIHKQKQRMAYIQNKINHLRSHYNTYLAVKSVNSNDYIQILLQGQHFYNQIFRKQRNGLDCINNLLTEQCNCENYKIKNKNKQFFTKNVPKFSKCLLKQPFAIDKNCKNMLYFMCDIFSQNQFQKQIPFIKQKQICAMIELVDNEMIHQNIKIVESTFKQSKINFKKYIPFQSIQQNLKNELKKQNPTLVYYKKIIYLYSCDKLNNLSRELKKIQKLEYILHFITENITVQSIKIQQIKYLQSLIYKKFSINLKLGKVKSQDSMEKKPQSTSICFDQVGKQGRVVNIYVYLVLFFSSMRPISNILSI